MHNEIDFSKVECLAPRADSWDEVCARLDAMEHSKQAPKANKLIRLPLYTAIPVAASFVLIGITVIVTALSHTKDATAEYIDIGELATWFDDLGNNGDDYEELDEYGSISYLIQ